VRIATVSRVTQRRSAVDRIRAKPRGRPPPFPSQKPRRRSTSITSDAGIRATAHETDANAGASTATGEETGINGWCELVENAGPQPSSCQAEIAARKGRQGDAVVRFRERLLGYPHRHLARYRDPIPRIERQPPTPGERPLVPDVKSRSTFGRHFPAVLGSVRFHSRPSRRAHWATSFSFIEVWTSESGTTALHAGSTASQRHGRTTVHSPSQRAEPPVTTCLRRPTSAPRRSPTAPAGLSPRAHSAAR
jgi:hypothetical protein